MRVQENRFMFPKCDVLMWWQCTELLQLVAKWKRYESKCFSNTLVKISVGGWKQTRTSPLGFHMLPEDGFSRPLGWWKLMVF